MLKEEIFKSPPCIILFLVLKWSFIPSKLVFHFWYVFLLSFQNYDLPWNLNVYSLKVLQIRHSWQHCCLSKATFYFIYTRSVKKYVCEILTFPKLVRTSKVALFKNDVWEQLTAFNFENPNFFLPNYSISSFFRERPRQSDELLNLRGISWPLNFFSCCQL